jgi:hypothetical protein
VVELFEGAVSEEELQEGQVRKSRFAAFLDLGATTLHSAEPSALQLEAEATTEKAHLELSGVSGGHRSRQPSFEDWRYVAKEPWEVGHAHVEGVMAVAVEPVQRRLRDDLV